VQSESEANLFQGDGDKGSKLRFDHL